MYPPGSTMFPLRGRYSANVIMQSFFWIIVGMISHTELPTAVRPLDIAFDIPDDNEVSFHTQPCEADQALAGAPRPDARC